MSIEAGGRSDRRARRFARLWAAMEGNVDEMSRPAKHALFADLPRDIVEIGPGRGANFAYYPAGSAVVALEPNVYFHDQLRAAAEDRGIEVDVRPTGLSGSGLADGSCDVVISTFVLCSVDDRDADLAEVHRILRPGGSLLFVEHVAAPPGSGRALVQRLLRRPWKAIGDGCDPHPDTVAALDRSGLTVEDTTLEPLGSVLDPTNPTYWGRAAKR